MPWSRRSKPEESLTEATALKAIALSDESCTKSLLKRCAVRGLVCDSHRIAIAAAKQVSPLLAVMHQQKEAFRDIFETAKDWSEGTFKLLDWLADAETNFAKRVETMKRWLSEITGYFDHRTTSGAVAGINHR
jgi:Transposase